MTATAAPHREPPGPTPNEAQNEPRLAPQIESQIERVRAALAADPDTGPYAAAFTVHPGDPWRIDGEVPSIAARRKAVRVARRALPYVEIDDGVRLAREVRRSDDELARALREALRHEPALPGVHVLEPGSAPLPLDEPWVGTIVRGGIIYLGGWLPDLAAKSVVEGLAWETAACSDVINLISHEPRGEELDADIATAVQTLIHGHPDLAGERVDIAVDHAEVRVTGAVADPGRRELIRSLCWFVPAVRDVRIALDADARPGGDLSA